MSSLARLALLSLARAPARAAIRLLALAAAAALVGAMVLFIGHAQRTMTGLAVRSVPLDWQGPVGSAHAASRVAADVARQPGVAQASPVATARFTGVVHQAAVGAIAAGAGSVLAVPPDYLAHLPTFRFLRGTLRDGEIVLDQQLAATLQAQPGDTVALALAPGRRRSFRVSGVVAVSAGDTLFQPLDPLLGPAPAQPPANVAILPFATFARLAAGNLEGVQWQVQAQVDPGALGGSPSHALATATRLRNRVERSLPGEVQFVDNLSDRLSAAAGDALYAEALFIMLALPGAIVALGLAYLAALGTVERDRREILLLRARGADTRALFAMAAVEAAVLGIVAGGLATAIALGSVEWVIGGPTAAGRIGAAAGICVGVAVIGAFAARVAAMLPALRGTTLEPTRPVRPLWQRLWLDLIALGGSAFVYWLTVRTGFSAVVNPDSNPTLSLSVYMFLAPALLWVGAALLVLRLRGRLLGTVARIAARGRPGWRFFLLASASRRGPALNRGLLLVGLLLAFGVELALFSATYDRQARIDAELTLGADVVATAPAGAIDRFRVLQTARSLPGVSAASPVLHAYAYVGPDLQDIFGVDPASIGGATTLRDSYFEAGSGRASVARLAARHDGVLVSKETITDYSLHIGDLLRLRVLDRHTGRFAIVPFHVAGIVREFPSAPHDSFMVAELGYLTAVTGEPGPNVVFARASGDERAVASRLSAATLTAGTSVKNIRTQTAQTVSSITTIDLRGISRIEEAFALALAALALALLTAVGIAERRQELATMSALGAPLHRIAAFIWSEIGLVLVAAAAFAALLGWLLAEMLVAMLQHVFDPPPDQLAVPWPFLGALAGAAVAGAVIVAIGGTRLLRRLPLGAILREE